MTEKRFGIKITLPAGDAMAAKHLLGPDWAGYRWYASAEERDRAFEQMSRQPRYYRRGDLATQVLAKVDS